MRKNDEDKYGWDVNAGYTEKEALETISKYSIINNYRVYEFEDGNIREVDKDDFQRYLIPLRAPKLTQDTRLGGVLANEDPKELRRQQTQYFGEPDVTRDAFDYLPDNVSKTQKNISRNY
jgi:hypothetical protein